MLFFILLIFEIFILYLLKRAVSIKIFRFLLGITKNRNRAIYLFAILFLPGTFIHEMSHFLTALFLLVPVGQIELVPVIEENGVRMGSVPIGKTDIIRRTLIGVAPILFGLAIIFITISLPISWFIRVYIAFEIGNTMFSSERDLEGVIPFLVFLIIVYIILYFLGVRISFPINMELFKTADIFLLIPIGVDLLLWYS